jgi:hypothetical protein
VTPEDFKAFHDLATAAAVIARRALDSQSEGESAAAWRELFGNRFPEGADEGGKSGSGGGGATGGFTPRAAPTIITGGRFA